MVGHVDDGLKRRHMICPDAGKYPPYCDECDARAVHEEMVQCQDGCCHSGNKCIPVSQTNDLENRRTDAQGRPYDAMLGDML